MARPPGAGWLPDRVQLVANAAARAGLIPVVTVESDEVIDLEAPGGQPLAIVGEVGGDVTAYLEETVHDPRWDEDVPVEVRGLDAILAWIAQLSPARITDRKD